ncbi:hypothetical protein CH267_04715 [Rhodococcus sp. 06-621-2]|nr:hypothetical protein CH267_04715 [Rhodococcus sp. 06-621-2]
MDDSSLTEGAVAIIPARGGSKGVHGKNLRQVGGVPLIVRAIRSCLNAAKVSVVYVSTDDNNIASAALNAGARVITRPSTISGDTATSESALIHALSEIAKLQHLPKVTLFVQCTSPFIMPADIDSAIDKIVDEKADTVISVARTHRFIWHVEGSQLRGINHDGLVRKRRQDLEPQYMETGAFYALHTKNFLKSETRFMQKTVAQEVDDTSSIEIDTEADLIIANAIAASFDSLSRIKAIITDFDGVHTDDTAYIDQNGVESVRISRSDGMGLGMLRKAGIPMLILSKEQNRVVQSRGTKLGIDVIQGIDDKQPQVLKWLCDKGVRAEDAAYVGNDINDISSMKSVGWPIAVADARSSVKACARIVLSKPGGGGALRELADLVLLEANSE